MDVHKKLMTCLQKTKTCSRQLLPRPIKRYLIRRQGGKIKMLTGLVGILFLFYSMIYLMPSLYPGFNKPCYLNQQELEAMRTLAIAVIQTLEDLNEQYWLDFGTLLGALRKGDILRHDYNLDISRVHHKYALKEAIFAKKFRTILSEKYNMSGNTRLVTYDNNGKTYRCDVTHYTQTRDYVTKETSLVENVRTGAESWTQYVKTMSFPTDVILPTRRMSFLGKNVRIPRRYIDVIKYRYPFTWKTTFPYKWRCWLPLL